MEELKNYKASLKKLIKPFQENKPFITTKSKD